MADERHDAETPGMSRAWAAGVVLFAILLGAASAMAGSGVGLLLFVVIAFGAGIWLLFKVLGGHEQPLSHGGRRYEPPEEEERRDVA